MMSGGKTMQKTLMLQYTYSTDTGYRGVFQTKDYQSFSELCLNLKGDRRDRQERSLDLIFIQELKNVLCVL
jgi:hypothetical protein